MRPRRAIVLMLLGCLVAVAVVLGVLVALRSLSSVHHTAPPVARHNGSSKPASEPATSLGPYGVEARSIRVENERKGTTAWKIDAPSPTGSIEGFADHVYAGTGDTVVLYVSTSAPQFRVEAYRMGYYHGDGARLVWRSRETGGRRQPACSFTARTNTTECQNWTRSLKFRVTAEFAQGDYLLKLVGTGGEQRYVPLTVWDPASHAAYLIKNDVYTWQAWNAYGGYDFYAGKGKCPPNVYPLCSRARVVSFDRPYGDGNGAGDFLGNEYPLVRFAEQHGLDVAYATDLTVEEQPGLLLDHRALLSLGHDECWSRGEREAAVAAEGRGVNMVFFAASPILRHVRLQPSPLGRDRQEVNYRNSHDDPLNGKGNPRDVTGNTWSDPPASWSETSFVGEAYAGFLEPGATPADFRVVDPSAWIFKGTRLRAGSVIPGLLKSDFDQFYPLIHPAHEEILAHSPIPLRHAQSQTGAADGHVYSDMTYYSDSASGAGVVDTGTNNWIPALNACPRTTQTCPATAVTRITGNLLWLFGQGPAGRLQPATPNWQQFYPPR